MGTLSNTLTRIIDWFYIKPIRRTIPPQAFHYAVCGMITTVASWLYFYLSFHYILHKEDLDLGFVVISPHIAALGIAFILAQITGFLLQKNISFRRSPLRGRIQLIRYLLSGAGSLVINYLLMKLLVDMWGFFPTPSQMVSSVIIMGYSYMMQKYFTFRGCEE